MAERLMKFCYKCKAEANLMHWKIICCVKHWKELEEQVKKEAYSPRGVSLS